MPTPNVDLLREALQEIEYSPNYWSPDVIAYCEDDEWGIVTYGFEGHAIALTHPDAVWHWVSQRDSLSSDKFGYGRFAVLVSVDGSRKKPGRNASYVARKLLGLDAAQADRLFGARTIDEVRRIVGELCGGAP